MASQRQIEVPTEKGRVFVPATNHVDETPFLAVTMCIFGQFEVTHVPSGFRLIGGYERAVNAFVSMAQLQLALNELVLVSCYLSQWLDWLIFFGLLFLGPLDDVRQCSQ